MDTEGVKVQLTTEQALLTDAGTLIDSWFVQQAETGHFAGRDDVQIAYARVLPKDYQRVIVIVSGRSESYIKYKELCFDLVQQGYGVCIMDHRGQGLSQRLSPHHQHGHVDDFAEYVDDLYIFMQTLVPQDKGKPCLLCHSMGGAIGLLFALRYPDAIAKMAFTAPMFGLKVPVPMWLAHVLLNVGLSWSKLRHRPHYFLGQSDFADVPFAENKLTQSKVRYQRFKHTQSAMPQTQLGGVTVQWVRAANQALEYLAEHAYQCRIPCLCLSSGAEQVVDNAQQRFVVNQLPSGKWQSIADAQHEILFEVDDIRNPAICSIIDFFADDLK
jgi:lysophospholipase